MASASTCPWSSRRPSVAVNSGDRPASRMVARASAKTAGTPTGSGDAGGVIKTDVAGGFKFGVFGGADAEQLAIDVGIVLAEQGRRPVEAQRCAIVLPGMPGIAVRARLGVGHFVEEAPGVDVWVGVGVGVVQHRPGRDALGLQDP